MTQLPPDIQQLHNINSQMMKLLIDFTEHHKNVSIEMTKVLLSIQNLSEKMSSPSNQYIMDEILKLQRDLYTSLSSLLNNSMDDLDSSIENKKSVLVTHIDSTKENIKENIKNIIEDEITEINDKIKEFNITFIDFKNKISWLFGIAMIAWGIVAGYITFIK
jgi:hypothetical protein